MSRTLIQTLASLVLSIVVLFAPPAGAVQGIATKPLPNPQALLSHLEGSEPVDTAARRAVALSFVVEELRQWGFSSVEITNAMAEYDRARAEQERLGKELLAKSKGLKAGSQLDNAWKATRRKYESGSYRAEALGLVAQLQMPRPEPPRSEEEKAKSNFLGWVLILSTGALALYIVVAFNRHAAPKTVRAAVLATALPAEAGVTVDALHLGIQRLWERTGSTVTVTGATGHVRDHGRWYSVYDLGYSVTNRSGRWLRFQMRLSPGGHHPSNDRYAWVDLAPNESRRVAFQLDVRGAGDFIAHRVTELAVGQTPPGGANQGAHFDFVAQTQLGLRQLLACDALGIWTKPKLTVLQMLLVSFGCLIVTGTLMWSAESLLGMWF
jgi:hypothetical protein